MDDDLDRFRERARAFLAAHTTTTAASRLTTPAGISRWIGRSASNARCTLPVWPG